MTNLSEVWNIYQRLMRQFPYWPSTFSTCSRCEKHSARGSDVCAFCIEEELAVLIGTGLAKEAVEAAKTSPNFWYKIYKELKNE